MGKVSNISAYAAILLFPVLCLAQAGDHAKAERVKQEKVKLGMHNKVYPKTKSAGSSTLRRYKNTTIYYNNTLHPTGAPKYVREIGDYQLYRRQVRKIRHRCNGFYKNN